MIGLVLQFLTGGLFDSSFYVLSGSVLACFAICGIYRCSQFRMRDCTCIKRFMRATGCDPFDDFEMLVVVHEAMFTATKVKMYTCVRVTAGVQTVMTSENGKGLFQETLSVFVEQGTDSVVIDLMDSRDRRVIGTLKMDVVKDLLEKAKGQEQTYLMKQKSKGVLNPKVRLSIHLDSGDGLEKGLLSDTGMSKETDMLIRTQLLQTSSTLSEDEKRKGISKSELIAKGFKAGPLEMFGSWGSKETVWVAIRSPTQQVRKYTFCIFKDEKEQQKGSQPKIEVDLLKILSVQPDPGRPEVFVLSYMDKEKGKKMLTFRRIDRSRDIWVEMFNLLITMIREEKVKKTPSPVVPM